MKKEDLTPKELKQFHAMNAGMRTQQIKNGDELDAFVGIYLDNFFMKLFPFMLMGFGAVMVLIGVLIALFGSVIFGTILFLAPGGAAIWFGVNSRKIAKESMPRIVSALKEENFGSA